MRLAVVVDRFPVRTECFVARECAALARLGFDLTIFALRPADAPDVPDGAPDLVRRVRVLPRPFSGAVAAAKLRAIFKKPLRFLSTGARALVGGLADPRHFAGEALRLGQGFVLARELEVDDYDLVLGHFAYAPSSVAWVASRLSGVPFVMSVHAWDVFVNRSLVGVKLADARRVLACTQAAIDCLRARHPHVPPSRYALLRHGVELPETVTRARRAPEARRGENAPLRILSVGRLVAKKGHATLLEACARLARKGLLARLDILGDGPLRGALEEKAKALDLGERVSFAGSVPPYAVTKALETADVFALASTATSEGDRDGLSNAAVEAMARAVPVVTTTAGAAAEVIRDGEEGLLVPPDDPEALAKALERLAREPELHARVGAAGCARARAEFDLDLTAHRLADTLIEIIEAAAAERDAAEKTEPDTREDAP